MIGIIAATIFAILYYRAAKRVGRNPVAWLFVGMGCYFGPSVAYTLVFLVAILPIVIDDTPDDDFDAAVYIIAWLLPGPILGITTAVLVYTFGVRPPPRAVAPPLMPPPPSLPRG